MMSPQKQRGKSRLRPLPLLPVKATLPRKSIDPIPPPLQGISHLNRVSGPVIDTLYTASKATNVIKYTFQNMRKDLKPLGHQSCGGTSDIVQAERGNAIQPSIKRSLPTEPTCVRSAPHIFIRLGLTVKDCTDLPRQ